MGDRREPLNLSAAALAAVLAAVLVATPGPAEDFSDPQLFQWYIAARLSMIEGRPRDAVKFLDAAIAAFPEASAPLHATLAQARLSLGRRDGAAIAARAALAEDPDLVEAHRVLVEILLENPTTRDLPDLERHLSAVVAADPLRDPDSRLRLATIYQYLQQPDSAIATLQGFRPGAPGYTRARLEIGNLLLARGETISAEAAYQESARSRPENRLEVANRLDALRRLGELRERQGDPHGAREAYAGLAEANPADGDALRRLSRVLLASGDETGARATLARLREIGPNDDLDRLSILLSLRAGRVNEAETTILGLQERTGETVNWVVFAELGRLLGETEAARRGYDRAREHNRADTLAGWGLAMLEAAEGDIPRAEAILLDLVEIVPDFAPALNWLAYTWACEGRRLDEAEAYIRRALVEDSGSAFYLDTLGWILHRRGDETGAIDALDRALASMPGDPTILDHRGDVLLSLGRPDDALAAWRAALAAGGGENAREIPEKIERAVNPE